MPHTWIRIAVGRVCTECSLAQPTGEFSDVVGCKRDKPYIAPADEGKPESADKKG